MGLAGHRLVALHLKQSPRLSKERGPPHLESWLEWREAAERLVPGHVEDELRGYLECGILCFGGVGDW
jgi:hypothetical protein